MQCEREASPDRDRGGDAPEPPHDEGREGRARETRDPDEVRAEEAFIRGLLARGEAARAKDGKLPPGVLYEIVDEPPGELPKVVRRRFSR